jgi:hypothetical protein
MIIGGTGLATAKDVGGVQYQESTRIGETPLMLNGAGVRQQSSAALYSIGLYADKRLTTPQEVFDATGPVQLRLVMLREVGAKKLSDMLTQGLIANSTDEGLETLITEIFTVGTMLNKQGKLLAGDTVVIHADAARNITVSIRGTGRGIPATQSFAKPAMYKAMMGIWLGPRAVDSELKKALLGQKI